MNIQTLYLSSIIFIYNNITTMALNSASMADKKKGKISLKFSVPSSTNDIDNDKPAAEWMSGKWVRFDVLILLYVNMLQLYHSYLLHSSYTRVSVGGIKQGISNLQTTFKYLHWSSKYRVFPALDMFFSGYLKERQEINTLLHTRYLGQ